MAKRRQLEFGAGESWTDHDVQIKIEDEKTRSRIAIPILLLAAVLLLGAMAYGFWTSNDSIIERLLDLGEYIVVGMLGWVIGRQHLQGKR